MASESNTIRIGNTQTSTFLPGCLEINNPSNNQQALYVATTGTGKTGFLEINNPSNSSDALVVKTNGNGSAGLFYCTKTTTNDVTLYAENSGIANAGYFKTTNASNNAATLAVETNGLNNAGYFKTTYSGTGNPNPTVSIENSTKANSLNIKSTNTSSAYPAVWVEHNGKQPAAFIYGNNPSTSSDNQDAAIYAKSNCYYFTIFADCQESKQTDGISALVYSSTNYGLSSNGLKTAIVETSDGARALYCEESAEVYFSDYGSGKLLGNEVTVQIDKTFIETVNLSTKYFVFLQSEGPGVLYVTEQDSKCFKVKLVSGEPNISFSYRIVAKRLDCESIRLERFPKYDNYFKTAIKDK